MSLLTPVRYGVKYYSWEDADAPVLTNEDGSFKTVLKACLVTGYGSKEGAGWKMKFEDDFRMVLVMPMGVFSPPDIRIENGNNQHRICSVLDATGLDDVPLVQQNIVTKDRQNRNEWHMVVSDFGFWFYGRFGSAYTNNAHHVMYVGAVSPYHQNKPKYLLATSLNGAEASGFGGWMYTLTHPYSNNIINLVDGTTSQLRLITLSLGEMADGHNVGQRCFTHTGDSLPVYAGMTAGLQKNEETVKNITLSGRPMLCTPQSYPATSQESPRIYYVPLDYWEL